MKNLQKILAFGLIILMASCSKKLYVSQINNLTLELGNCKKNDKKIFHADAVRYSNVLFIGLENSIEIDHNFKDSLIYEVDNGEIEKKKETVFFITPNKIGELNLLAYKKEGNTKKLLVKQNFRVQNLPTPVIKFNGKTSFELSKASLLKLERFTCNQAPHFEYFVEYEIVSFNAKVLRVDRVVDSWIQKGDKVRDETKKLLLNTESGDFVIISDCIVKKGALEEKLNPMIYRIK